MLFNSYIFIFLFFPLCLLGYYGLKNKNAAAAKVWLIVFSLWFYGYFNIRYLCIMLFSILLNYGIYQMLIHDGYQNGETRKEGVKTGKTIAALQLPAFIFNKKIILSAGVGANLLLLFYFKYYDFFIENINAVFGTSFALRHILLPLGISFFTFQQISFLADTYRGELKECSFIDYTLFVSFFPQLIAGPIVTQEEMLPQFSRIGKEKWNEDQFCRGLFIFVLGMGKKVLIADTFGAAVDAGYAMVSQLGSIDAVLVMLFYTLQLYFDFSGYCDMAIGIGKMMGIEIPINFDSPYKAGNIIVFWKRWHITLSRFFTKNIYIPLGGNRKGPARMYINLFLVFFLSGIWHGAGWNFILWGVMHGVLYCVTRWWQINHKKKAAGAENSRTQISRGETNAVRGLGFVGEKNAADRSFFGEETSAARRLFSGIVHAAKVFATFLYVNAAWVFFRSTSLEEAFILWNRMFTGGIAPLAPSIYEAFNLDEFWYVLKVLHLTDYSFSPYILMILFTVVILLVTFFGKNVHQLAKEWKMSGLSAVAVAIVFVWCVVSLSGVSTFLYFNF